MSANAKNLKTQARDAQLKLKKLRREIDRVDRLLLKALAKRFRIVSEVGRLKLRYGLPIVQKSRMTEMLNGRRDDAIRLKLSGRLVYKIYDLIHDASIRCQEDIVMAPGRKERARKTKR